MKKEKRTKEKRPVSDVVKAADVKR